MERPLQPPQECEGLNMPLATNQAKEDPSGASWMLRVTMRTWTNS